ncbi:MAG: TrkA C-terminal domain-containing protein [Eubacteriales bacterium]|nr:TrkA C-terminal domain-containing protein [Eubacteriales bacterium]
MSLVIFLILFILIWFLVEILAIVMKLTGLELSKARFQLISILTHTGFTTRESELIVQHPTRRKIASAVMIISYVAQITLITLLFNVLTQAAQNMLGTAIALSILVLFVMVVSQSKFLADRFDRITERLLKNRIKKVNSNDRIEQILNLSPEFSIYELIVDVDSFICDKSLSELKLKEHFIQILKIDRGSEMIDFPKANTRVLAGDRMIVYGKIDALTEMIMKQ